MALGAKTLAALGAPAVQDLAAPESLHSGSKTVSSSPADLGRLIGALHESLLNPAMKIGYYTVFKSALSNGEARRSLKPVDNLPSEC